MSVCLFIYGTLKRGERNHRLLRDQFFLGEVQTAPAYRLYRCGSYPGLVRSASGLAIQGELWQVDEPALERLDQYEGVPTLFAREPIQLQGVELPVLAYFWQRCAEGLPDCGHSWQS